MRPGLYYQEKYDFLIYLNPKGIIWSSGRMAIKPTRYALMELLLDFEYVGEL